MVVFVLACVAAQLVVLPVLKKKISRAAVA